MSSDALGSAAAPAAGRFGLGRPAAPSGTGPGCGTGPGSLDLWVAVLAELDDLEVKNLLPAEDLRRLRKSLLSLMRKFFHVFFLRDFLQVSNPMLPVTMVGNQPQTFGRNQLVT